MDLNWALSNLQLLREDASEWIVSIKGDTLVASEWTVCTKVISLWQSIAEVF